MIIVYCWVKVSARDPSLVQRGPTECVVSESDREVLIMTKSWPLGTVVQWEIKIYIDQ